METLNGSASALNAREIVADLMPEDMQALWHLDYGLRTNQAIVHQRAALKRLIVADVAMSSGMDVRITPLDCDVLRLRPAPR